MTDTEFTESVRNDLRQQLAAGREYNELLAALEGSDLWETLTTPQRPAEGRCVECDAMTEDYDEDDEFICDYCRETLVAGQLEDQRLDDPRHGGI